MTAVHKCWKTKYEQVRSVMRSADALLKANQAVEQEFGISLAYSEKDNKAVCEATLPNKCRVEESRLGYLTDFIRLGLTEELLSRIKLSDLKEKR